MLTYAKLSGLELGIICMVVSFCITIMVILAVGMFYKYYKKETFSEKEKVVLRNKRKRNKLITSNKEKIFHFKKNAFIFRDNEDSTLQYIVMYKAETRNLAIKIIDIIIGGRTSCIKSHMTELNEVFFRILLNSNTTNSIITSDLYTFSSNIYIEEMFLFSLKEHQLHEMSIIIDVFVTLSEKQEDMLIGSAEIILPETISKHHCHDNITIQQFTRPIDLYMKPVGYTCISLESLHDIIKIGILASNFNIEAWISNKNDKSGIFFHLLMKNEKDFIIEHACKTSVKLAASTMIWNEVFMFNVPNTFKRNNFIEINLWEKGIGNSTNYEEPTLVGSIQLGSSENFSEMSKNHWNYILDFENKENCRWHPIRQVK